MSQSKGRHPAPFNEAFLRYVVSALGDQFLRGPMWLLDPMAGTCRLHRLQGHHGDVLVRTFCSELEPEWTEPSPDPALGFTQAGVHAFQALHDRTADEKLFAGPRWIVTSPVWGNRMADHHEAKDESDRLTYRHRLGRPVSEGSSCSMPWGDEYRAWHTTFLRYAYETSLDGERMFIEIGDHLRTVKRTAVRAQVTAWWIKAGVAAGWHLERAERLSVGRLRKGANHAVRIPYIHALELVK